MRDLTVVNDSYGFEPTVRMLANTATPFCRREVQRARVVEQ
jgi:hypothetical protein